MVWARFDDKFWTHQKTLAAGNEAVGAFVRLVCWSCQQLSDGFVPNEIARFIATPSVLRRLVDVGFLDVAEGGANGPKGGYSVRNFLTYQPSRASVENDREKTRSRVEKFRENKASSAVGNAVTTPVTNGVSNGGCTGAPTRPDPTRQEEMRGREPLRAPDPDPPALKLTVGEPAAPKAPRRPRKAPDAEPPPFSHLDALAALAGASGGRVAHVEPRDLDGGTTIALRKMVRSYPSLEEWRTCGEWIAAGGERTRQKFGASWAASSGLRDAMAASRAWAEQGRPALLDARGFPVVTVAAEPADDPWARAMRKAEERGLA